MNKLIKSFFCASGLFAITTTTLLSSVMPAMAVNFNLNSVTGRWTNPVGGSNITGADTNEIRWGSGLPNSGLRFDGSAPPVTTVSLDNNFVLGEVTHFNFTVPTLSAISGTNLNIALNLNSVESTFQYNFKIDETPNQQPCPAFQQSATLCDDKISFASGLTSDSFSADGKEYTLQLLGFSRTDDGSNLISDFITEESKQNQAFLIGKITESRSVPEPTSILGLSILGVGLVTRRSLKKSK